MNQTNRECSVESTASSVDSSLTEWMESRPSPEVTVSDDKVLFEMLKNYPTTPLHDVLTKICHEIPAARELAIKELLIYKDELLEDELCDSFAQDPDDHEADGKGPSHFERGEKERDWRCSAAGIGRPFWRQKCAKYEICTRCGEEYEHTFVAPDDCKFHPGRMIVDKRSPIWDFESLEKTGWGILENTKAEYVYLFGWEYGFKWDCCNTSVCEHWKPCRTGRHLPKTIYAEGISDKTPAKQLKAGKKKAGKIQAEKKPESGKKLVAGKKRAVSQTKKLSESSDDKQEQLPRRSLRRKLLSDEENKENRERGEAVESATRKRQRA